LWVGALIVWLLGARLQIALLRAAAGTAAVEWAVVWLAMLTSLVLCLLLVHLAGLWGLGVAVPSVVAVWKQAARLMRQRH
jgi:hypothetical protein